MTKRRTSSTPATRNGDMKESVGSPSRKGKAGFCKNCEEPLSDVKLAPGRVLEFCSVHCRQVFEWLARKRGVSTARPIS